MAEQPLSEALEREHHEVDAALAAFLAQLDAGQVDAAAIAAALTALRRHIYLEEEILFPPLRTGARMMSIFGMIRGHGEIWQTIDALAAGVADGADAETLRGHAAHLLELLTAHNKVEEPVIYPGADTDLTPEQTSALAGFLADGVMPAGWVCEKAR